MCAMTFYVNKGSNHNLIITFDYSPERVKKIKQITNRWNALEKHWEIPATEQSISRFLSVLQDEVVIFDPSLDFVTGSNLVNSIEMVWLKELIKKNECALKLKGYSSLTISAYMGHTLRFFEFIKKQPDQVINEDIEEYLLNILEKKKVSLIRQSVLLNLCINMSLNRIISPILLFQDQRRLKSYQIF